MAQYSGFPAESFDTVFIILDKMDKIGIEGVAEELEKEGFAKESIDTYLGLFREITNDVEGVRYIKEKLSDVLEAAAEEAPDQEAPEFHLVKDSLRLFPEQPAVLPRQ